MRLLLDTHTFLFSIFEPEALPPRLLQLLSDETVERWVSVVTHWEIAVKSQIGKLDVPADPDFYLRHAHLLQAKPLSFEPRHCIPLYRLPMHHKDPFDRLLISQAIAEGMTLASRDRDFMSYPVERLWE
jgi:PIN domain nuclease of toxin-antitoxin system